MVVVVLPTGVAHFNTVNTDIVVWSTQEELIIKIIWPHNMMDVKLLLSQFMMRWHREESSMRKRLALETAFNQLREKATNFMLSNVSILLPSHVQSKFNFDFVFNHDNRFHALMIHLREPYEGGMQHKMIQM